MASLFNPKHSTFYKTVLENGNTITIEFPYCQYVNTNEMCNLSDTYECFDKDDYRYILYARDRYDERDKKTFTYLTLICSEIGREYAISEMYLNDGAQLIYSDSYLIRN